MYFFNQVRSAVFDHFAYYPVISWTFVVLQFVYGLLYFFYQYITLAVSCCRQLNRQHPSSAHFLLLPRHSSLPSTRPPTRLKLNLAFRLQALILGLTFRVKPAPAAGSMDTGPVTALRDNSRRHTPTLVSAAGSQATESRIAALR